MVKLMGHVETYRTYWGNLSPHAQKINRGLVLFPVMGQQLLRHWRLAVQSKL